MQLHTGSSGFSYPEWKGSFYPADLKERDMLRWYGERLGAVEINNTFYRMPRAEVVRAWAAQVPPEFRFVIKVPKRIAWDRKLENVGDDVAYLWGVVQELGPRLGPLLFQLPRWVQRDVPRLAAFLAGVPEGMRCVFEFLHPSWQDGEVLDVLRQHGAALCTSDRDEDGDATAVAGDDEAPLVATADFGYLRLRRCAYGEADLQRWAQRIRGEPWREVFVFFKHEDEGAAPRLALQLQALFAAG